jgi:oligoendopeptidase F
MDFRKLSRATEAAIQRGHNQLGDMPTWNLTDLYPANDAPELKADLKAAQDGAKAFEADYKGKRLTTRASSRRWRSPASWSRR